MKRASTRRTARGSAMVVAMVTALAGLGAASLGVAGPAAAAGPAVAAGAAQSDQGVTRSTIDIGVATVDLQAVAQFTHGLTQGDAEGSYRALIDHLNKEGGIDGRKLVATYVSVSPLEASSADAACTQLTEDDKVFAVIGGFYGNSTQCYLQTHPTPIVGGTMTNALLSSAQAPWFTNTPNTDVLEPAAVDAAAKSGVFKGKTVGVLSASDVSQGLEAKVVGRLRAHGVNPKVTATVEANAADSEATLSQVSGVIAPKLQAAHVNVLVAVGEASSLWIDATGTGSYHPRLVATNYADATSTINGSATAGGAAAAGTVSAYTAPLTYRGKAMGWADPALQRCLNIIRASGVAIANPVTTPVSSTNQTWIQPIDACQIMTIFTAIAARAGKHLSAASFGAAGGSLGAVKLPGVAGKVTFDRAHPAGSFPLYLYRWDPSKHRWDISAQPVATS